MSLSVAGFPEPMRAGEPYADPTSARTAKEREYGDGGKKTRRPYSSQTRLSKSIIHPSFSHSSLYPTPAPGSFSLSPAILPAALPFPHRVALVPQPAAADFIPAYVYAMSAHAGQHPDAHLEPSQTLSGQPLGPGPARKPISVGTPTHRDTAGPGSFPPPRNPGPTLSPSQLLSSPAAGSSSPRPNISINTASLWNPLPQVSSQHPLPSQPLPPPNSRVLIPAVAKGRTPSPHKAGINLRYQSMAIVDPSQQASSSRPAKGDGVTMRKTPQSRGHRSKTSPGPRANTLEAIPSSWASASRPSDLRPVYPSAAQQKPTAPGIPPQAVPAAAPRSARPKVVGLRSRSVDRTNFNSRVAGPRMPRQAVPHLSLAQPPPKRLSLGMVMNTSKLVGTPSPSTSILGPNSISSSVPKPSIVTSSSSVSRQIRSIPSSPTGSPSFQSHVPAIARLPISGSPDWKRETSPPPSSTYRSVGHSPFRAWPTPLSSPPQHPPTSPVLPSPLHSRALPTPTHSHSTFRSAHILPSVPLSPFSNKFPTPTSSLSQSTHSSTTPLSPRSPPAIAITSPTTASASSNSPATTPDSESESGSDKEGEDVDAAKRAKRASSPDSPTSVLSYASVTIFTSGGTKRHSGSTGQEEEQEGEKRRMKDTHILQTYPYHIDIGFDPGLEGGEEEEEEEAEDVDPPLYEWGFEEIEHYNDQLFRFPISISPPPTNPTTSKDNDTIQDQGKGGGSLPPVVEVFVDNVYYNELERSPSPMIYARPGGDDFSDSETAYGVRRRRLAADQSKSRSRSRSRPKRGGGEANDTPPALPTTTSAEGNVARNGTQRHNKSPTGPSSPISYHSDDSTLSYYGTRPRRKRREQLRSYRYTHRPPGMEPISPTSPGADGPVSQIPSPHNLAPTRSLKKARTEAPRSPSPILYARRRSLDFLSDTESVDSLDGSIGAGSGSNKGVAGPWDSKNRPPSYSFLSSEPTWGSGLSGGLGGSAGRRVRRRTVQPRSFLYEYSTPPDVQPFYGDSADERTEREERERERREEKERERGRKRERALIPMPLVNYNRTDKEKEKEKEKEKTRTRKTSRGIFDELAAVAARNTISSRKPGTTTTGSTGSRSRSPKSKRKWKWDLKSDSKDKSESRVGDSSTSGSTIGGNSIEGPSGSEGHVLDIGGGSGSGGGAGYDDWSAEWEESPTTGMRRKKKQRHSLAGLEFR